MLGVDDVAICTLTERHSSTKGIDADATVEVSVNSGEIKVKGLSAGERVYLYSADGQLLRVSDAAGGCCSFRACSLK